jgi:hypothetical protein
MLKILPAGGGMLSAHYPPHIALVTTGALTGVDVKHGLAKLKYMTFNLDFILDTSYKPKLVASFKYQVFPVHFRY